VVAADRLTTLKKVQKSMNRIIIPILEVLGFFLAVCGIALWLIHDLYTIATIMIGIGGVMVVAGMWIEKKYVGYYND
jgi:uncharacterized membrane protein